MKYKYKKSDVVVATNPYFNGIIFKIVDIDYKDYMYVVVDINKQDLEQHRFYFSENEIKLAEFIDII